MSRETCLLLFIFEGLGNNFPEIRVVCARGWRNFFAFPTKQKTKTNKIIIIVRRRRLSMRTTTGFTFGTHGGRAGLKTSSSSSSLVRQFLPSSLVRFLDAHNNNTFDSSSSRFRRGRDCALFSTNAAGNDSRQQQQQQQQEEEEEEAEEEEEKERKKRKKTRCGFIR